MGLASVRGSRLNASLTEREPAGSGLKAPTLAVAAANVTTLIAVPPLYGPLSRSRVDNPSRQQEAAGSGGGGRRSANKPTLEQSESGATKVLVPVSPTIAGAAAAALFLAVVLCGVCAAGRLLREKPRT